MTEEASQVYQNLTVLISLSEISAVEDPAPEGISLFSF
jgi:hypothetical protein